MSKKGIEYSFLKNWSGWDEIDTGDLQFDGIELNDAGRELLGDQADDAILMTVLGSSSQVEFYFKDDTTKSFNVKLVVV